MLINGSTNEREIKFETIRGFSRGIDFHEHAGVTNDATRNVGDIGYGYLEVAFYTI
jgi:hypothetical protein